MAIWFNALDRACRGVGRPKVKPSAVNRFLHDHPVAAFVLKAAIAVCVLVNDQAAAPMGCGMTVQRGKHWELLNPLSVSRCSMLNCKRVFR